MLERRRLLRALTGEDDEARWRAARALSGLRGRGLRKQLEKILAEHESPQARAAAAYTLGFLGEGEAADALAQVLADLHEENEVRAYAAEALGHLLQYSVVLVHIRTTIVRGLRDPSAEVRFWSAFAAGVLGLQESKPTLEQLREDEAQIDGWWSVAEEAEWALRLLAGEENPPVPQRSDV